MTDIDGALLRQNLGLSEDATDEQVNEALQARAQQPAPEPAPNEPAGDPAPADEPAPVSSGEPETTTEASGAVMVDRETLASLEARATRGDQAFQRQRQTDRDSFLSAAVQAGKFAPARVSAWRNAWDKDPEGTEAAINSLADNLIPVEARGGSPNTEAQGSTEPYPAGWFPELQRNRSSAITQEV